MKMKKTAEKDDVLMEVWIYVMIYGRG